MLPLHPHDPPAIGPYRLLGRLGTDDTAHRYVGGEVGDVGGQASVTIVLLRPERATDPEFRAGFARRVEALQGLRSPYVCPVADADTRGAVPWAAFARPDAQTLAELIEGNGGVLPPREFPSVAAALAAGLADLHGAGVFAGPMRAENVLLGSGSAVVTVIAEAVSAEPDGDDGAAEDVRHWAALMSSVTGDVRPPLRFRKLIDGCLHPDPELRPTARELVRMLKGAGAAAPEGTVPPAEQRPRTGVLVSVAAGVLTVSVVTATAFVVTRDDRAETSDTAEAVVTDCTEARGFAPEDDRDGGELEVSTMRFSLDGDLLALASPEDGLSVWAWREGKEVARLSEGRYELGRVDFLAEGCVVAATVPDPSWDGDFPPMFAAVFDLVTGTSTEYRSGGPTSGPDRAFVASLHSMAVSPGGMVALAGWSPDGYEDHVRIVDGNSGDVGDGIDTILDSRGVWPVFVDERRLALTNSSGSGYWSFTVWDVRTGERLHTIAPASERVFAPIPETDELVYANGDEVIIIDFTTEKRVETFTLDGFAELQDPWVTGLTVDPWLGRVYATWAVSSEEVGEDPEYFTSAWDLETGEDLLPEGLAFAVVAPHPTGKIVAVKPPEGGVLFLDPETWETVGTL